MNQKKLYRTEGPDAKVAGVCGGLGEYFAVDPNILRVAAVLLCLFGIPLWGSGGLVLVAYIAAAVILPKKSDIYPGF